MFIFCINLAARTDRLAGVGKEFARLGLAFERFEAVYEEVGALGCTRSHIGCLRLASERGYEFCMICEDDLEFRISRKNFDKMMSGFLASDAMVLVVIGNTDAAGVTEGGDLFYRTTNTQTTTCYIVKRAYYELLLDNFMVSEEGLMAGGNKGEFALDIVWKRLQRDGGWVVPKLYCGRQIMSFSDIEGKEVDYGGVFGAVYRGKYVVINLAGGLGNRLFQVAFGYALAKRTGRVLLLKGGINVHSDIDYYDMMFARFFIYEEGISIESVRDEKIGRALGYDAGLVKNIRGNVDVRGYFQNERYFTDYGAELREIFVDKGRCDALKKKYGGGLEKGAFVHVRRGDYLTQKYVGEHYVDLRVYYRSAIQMMREMSGDGGVEFYVFSDDIEYCKKDDIFAGLGVFVEENEVDSMCLMAMCGLGGICANSSFSWWGAYLGGNERSVFFPNRWFGDKSKEKYTEVGFSGAIIVNVVTGKQMGGKAKYGLMQGRCTVQQQVSQQVLKPIPHPIAHASNIEQIQKYRSFLKTIREQKK